jgi:N-acetylglucosaminyl-diphospho-decaprenol L-rhamnosyltransferase
MNATALATTISVPWVRIIVVNYNAGPLLQDCVDALAAQTMQDFEVIILDNGSSDDSIVRLVLPDKRFWVQHAGANLGFAVGNNMAARDCGTPWIATLNPDTRPSPTWLAQLRAATERYPWARAFGSTQLDAASPATVDGFGDVFCVWGFAWRGCSGQSVTTLPSEDREVFAPCAAAALYERNTFHAVGGFDESFFCYLEDVDLGFRLRLRGERCVQVRRAEVLHIGSAISGRMSDFSIFHSYRNRIWMLAKNLPTPILILTIVVHVPIVLVLLSRPRSFNRMTAFKGNRMTAFKGIWAGIVGLGPALRSRKFVQRQRTIGSSALAGMMVWDLRKVRKRAPHFLHMRSVEKVQRLLSAASKSRSA